MGAREAQLRGRARQRRQAGQLRTGTADDQLDARVQRVRARDRARRPAPVRAALAIERPAGRADREPDPAVLAQPGEAGDRTLGSGLCP